jgi:phosphonate transport system substrate-binding protein
MKKIVLFVALLIVLATVTACVTPTPTPVPPTATTAPTAVPPTATKPPATATTVPVAAATATVPAAKCEKMAGALSPKAGELGAPDKPIVMTFVPSGDVPTITKSGEDTAACLKQITGLTYQINVQTSYAAAIEAMGASKAQFSFLATLAAILARQKYGIDPVLVSSRAYQTVDKDPDFNLKGTQQTFYKSQFITKKGSGITKLADLKGKTFCFVEPISASGTAFPMVVLAANGIDPDNTTTGLKAYTMAGSHPNVVAAVYKGDCDAGATYLDARTDATILKTYPDVMDKVDVFYVIDVKIPNDGMQVAKGVDPAIRDATVAGFLAMMADPGGKAVIKRAYTYDALEKVPVTYYDTLVETVKKSGIDLSKFLPAPK